MKQESWGRRLWRLIYPWLTYYGVSLIAEFAATGYLAFREIRKYGYDFVYAQFYTVLEEIIEGALSIALELEVIAAAVTLPILILYFYMDKKRDRTFGAEHHYTKVSPALYITVAILGITACIVGNNFILISGAASYSAEEAVGTLYGGQLALEFVGLGLIMPAVEEFIFRGLIYKRMRGYAKAVPAAIVSALLFGIYHGNMVQGIYAFCLGLLLVYVYERYHSIAAPIVMHVAANILSLLVSELGFLNRMYTSGQMFWTGTICSCVLLIIVVYFTENYVHSDEIEEHGGGDEGSAEDSAGDLNKF